MLTMFKHVLIGHATGVGGGSLVYANNLLIPSDKVFEDKAWCIENAKKNFTPLQSSRENAGCNPKPFCGES